MNQPAKAPGLADRIAIVTGGSRGIGKAVVELLASCGAHVVVNYVRDADAAAATVNAQSHGVKAIAIQADVSQLDQAERLVQETVEHFGRVDFLIAMQVSGKARALSRFLKSFGTRRSISISRAWSVCRARQ